MMSASGFTIGLTLERASSVESACFQADLVLDIKCIEQVGHNLFGKFQSVRIANPLENLRELVGGWRIDFHSMNGCAATGPDPSVPRAESSWQILPVDRTTAQTFFRCEAVGSQFCARAEKSNGSIVPAGAHAAEVIDDEYAAETSICSGQIIKICDSSVHGAFAAGNGRTSAILLPHRQHDPRGVFANAIT
jgi:hypothetical protein